MTKEERDREHDRGVIKLFKAALKLADYNPAQFGQSGDARMAELIRPEFETLPLAERQAALYGTLVKEEV